MKNIFIFLLITISSNLLSQSVFERGNYVLDLPENNWVEGTKKISVFLITNLQDTIIQSEEFYTIEGNRIKFVKYRYDSGDSLYVTNFTYENGKLIEEHKNTSWKKYYYKDGNIEKIEQWSFNSDTSISLYQHNEQDISKQTFLKKDKENYIKLFSYNKNHQLLSVSTPYEVLKKYDYDSLGHLITEIDVRSEYIERTHKYDNQNNLIETKVFLGSPKYVESVRKYKYNEKNQLIEWTYITGKRKVFKIEQYIYTEKGKKTLMFYNRLKKQPDEIFIEKYEYW